LELEAMVEIILRGRRDDFARTRQSHSTHGATREEI
jgi:hypothetical protein